LKVFVGGERYTRAVLRPAHDRQILSVRNLVSLDGIYSDTYSVYARQWRLQSQGVDIEAGKIAKTYEAPERMGIWSTPDKSFYYIYITDFIGGAAQEKYMNEQMKKLVAAKPAKIVIDLASNPGGETRMAQRFMSFLLNRGTRFASKLKIRTNRWRQPKNFIWISRERKKLLTRQYRALRKMPKRGRWRVGNLLKSTFGNRSHTPEIIVVVGPATRSAATMLAMTLKEFGGAKIVGRIGDISAKTSCTAVAGNHVLPRTKIQVAIPLVCFDRNVQKVSDEKALAPDYRIAGEVTNSNKLLMESLVQAFEPR